MPTPGKLWRHVTINTRCTWLHGDPRGFRDHDHRVHSSGDYKDPPPPDEHSGLHDYMNRRAGEPVTIASELRERIGLALVKKLTTIGHRMLVACVGSRHTHIVVELPQSLSDAKREIGRAKQAASHAVRDAMPGRIWADGGDFRLINDQEHARNTFEYILDHAEEGAWVWSYKNTGQKLL